MTDSAPQRLNVRVKQEVRVEEEELCRLCVGRVPEIFSLFTENIPELLSTYLGVTISEADNWPKSVCPGCLEKIHETVHFICKIRESEIVLKDLFGEREAIPLIVHIASGEKKADKSDEASGNKEEDSGILRQLLLGDISRCSYMTEKPTPSAPSTSILRDHLLKPLPTAQEPKSRMQQNSLPSKRHRRRRVFKPGEIKSLHGRIENFYSLRCGICSRNFDKFTELEEHFENIHGRRAYITCCSVKFTGLANLSEHLDYHANPNAFKCPHCGKAFKCQQSVDYHTLNQHTPYEMRKFQCSSCQQRFVTKKMLKQHEMVHAGPEKHHKCPHCMRVFEREASLKKHIRIFHDGSEHFSCLTCGMSFREVAALERHDVIHQEPQHVTCDVCGKSFHHKSSLRSHMYVHTASTEEDYECHLCGKKSVNKYAMRTHMDYVHLKQKIHKCKLCGSAYKRKHDLKQHMISHCGEATFPCNFCGVAFVTRAQSYAHRKTMHPNASWYRKKE